MASNAPEVFWTPEKEEALIEQWSEKPCLFDISCKDYSNRDSRAAAFEELSRKLEIPVRQIRCRMTSLRTQFTKAERGPQSGSSRSKVTSKTLRLLEKLQFLKPFIGVRQTVSSLEIATSECAEDEEILSDEEGEFQTIKEQPLKRPSESGLHVHLSKSAKKKRDQKEMDLLERLTNSVILGADSQNTTPQDECSTFGQYISSSLRAMDPKTRIQVKHSINTIIYNAQMGVFSSQGHSYGLSDNNSSASNSMYNQGFTQMLNSQW